MVQPTEQATYDDRALFALARAGDERAFGQLIERHSIGLQTLCRLMLGNQETARLVMSEVVVDAWRERIAIHPSVCPRVWLYRTALRMCAEADPSSAILREQSSGTAEEE